MSKENVELVRRMWEAWSRGDVEAASAFFAPDVDFDFSRDRWGDLVGGVQYRGIEGVKDWFRELWGAFAYMVLEVEDLVEAGDDEVITVLSARGRSRGGMEVLRRPAGVGTLRGGRIVRVVWFRNQREALEAMGLRE